MLKTKFPSKLSDSLERSHPSDTWRPFFRQGGKGTRKILKVLDHHPNSSENIQMVPPSFAISTSANETIGSKLRHAFVDG